MIEVLYFVLATLVRLFKAKSQLEAETAVIRQQLIVLRRKIKGLAPLTNMIAGSSSSYTGGFSRFCMFLRSFVPRL